VIGMNNQNREREITMMKRTIYYRKGLTRVDIEDKLEDLKMYVKNYVHVEPYKYKKLIISVEIEEE